MNLEKLYIPLEIHFYYSFTKLLELFASDEAASNTRFDQDFMPLVYGQL